MVTIREIAVALGMSPSTVSQALNNKGYLKPQTRERVRTAAMRMGYQTPHDPFGIDPELSGRPIRLLITGKQHEYHDYGLRLGMVPHVLEGIHEALHPFKIPLLLSSVNDFTVQEPRDLLATLVVGGVRSDLIALLEQSEAPVIVIGSHTHSPKISSVESDMIVGIRTAVKHLVDLGHTRIAFINGPTERETSDEKFTGFLRAAHEHRISSEFVTFLPESETGNMVPIANSTAIEMLPNEWNSVTGVICASDAISIGTVMAAESVGKRVPADLSVVSLGDPDVGELSLPPLTTVTASLPHMGRLAVTLALSGRRAQDLHGVRVIVRPLLTVRNSTRALVRTASVLGKDPSLDPSAHPSAVPSVHPSAVPSAHQPAQGGGAPE